MRALTLTLGNVVIGTAAISHRMLRCVFGVRDVVLRLRNPLLVVVAIQRRVLHRLRGRGRRSVVLREGHLLPACKSESVTSVMPPAPAAAEAAGVPRGVRVEAVFFRTRTMK